MGLSVELFRYLEEIDYWEYIDCIYTSMITPSRNLITSTMEVETLQTETDARKAGFFSLEGKLKNLRI